MPEQKYSVNAFYASLINWYDMNGRKLPWRTRPGTRPNPYKIWVSEIMLQQTTVATVKSRFKIFIKRWPTVDSLAKAELDEVLNSWQGLGYYARARNMHKCARIIAYDLNSTFPSDMQELIKLPGVGIYTAAAIAAIAFDCPVIPIDSNVARILTRVHTIRGIESAANRKIRKFATSLTQKKRPGDFAQALMDLGALICKPRNPDCPRCPINNKCNAYGNEDLLHYSEKNKGKPKPKRWGLAFWLHRPDGKVLFYRRPESGLLGGMIDLPGSDWHPEKNIVKDLQKAPLPADWNLLPGEVKHVFSHFQLILQVAITKTLSNNKNINGFWHSPLALEELALSTLTKKIISHVRRFE